MGTPFVPSYLFVYLTLNLAICASRLMWAVNAVLTARVYLNLVWLARKPMVTADASHGGLITGGGVSANIHLQIRPSATIRADTWRSSGLGPNVYTIPTLDIGGSHGLRSLRECDHDEDIHRTV
jgi:hypothetical protein